MRLNKLDGETDYFDVAPAIGMSGIYYNTYGGTAILYDVTINVLYRSRVI